MESKDSVWWYMVLFGVIRHVMGLVGMWLHTRGLIDADTHKKVVDDGTTQVVAYILMAAPFIWSILQKSQVIAWVKKALHLTAATTPREALKAAPGPDVPI